ncbi:hypothetical protein H4Q26_001822 [Puccinia striiformis f. sp. tritici PST-130]|nr:hypothetical protein H4Q26_001822 [Puccinia striiformis f. sp. tritici PST-130]
MRKNCVLWQLRKMVSKKQTTAVPNSETKKLTDLRINSGAVIASQIVNNSDPPTLLEQISHNTSGEHRSKELRQLCLRKLAKEGKESPKLKVSAESIQMISYKDNLAAVGKQYAAPLSTMFYKHCRTANMVIQAVGHGSA